MENILSRFPDIGKAILVQVDNKSLVTSREVSRIWRTFTGHQKTIWIRMIKKYIGQQNTFSKDWNIVVSKTKFQTVKDLAIAVQEFYESHNGNKKYFPLYVAVDQNNLQMTQHIIRRVKEVNSKDFNGVTSLYIAAK